MNIFAYHPDPYMSALWLDDVRKNKMVLESCQMLSTAVHFVTPEDTTCGSVYKIAYKNHPCTVWCRASAANFKWLLDHTYALAAQLNKNHKSSGLLPVFTEWLHRNEDQFMFDINDLTPFANCARNVDLGLDFTHYKDTHQAYRKYTSARWKTDTIPLSWNHGVKPKWCPV